MSDFFKKITLKNGKKEVILSNLAEAYGFLLLYITNYSEDEGLTSEKRDVIIEELFCTLQNIGGDLNKDGEIDKEDLQTVFVSSSAACASDIFTFDQIVENIELVCEEYFGDYHQEHRHELLKGCARLIVSNNTITDWEKSHIELIGEKLNLGPFVDIYLASEKKKL
tara:strand:- start:80 stop:580 length:501 start_codon:yes stop_codon:yes gene_type:complete